MAETPESEAKLNSGLTGTGGNAATTGRKAGGINANKSASTTTPLDTAGPPTSSEGAAGTTTESAANRRAEARSRFNAALEEAKAGLEALRADAAERGANYRSMASTNTSDWVEEVKVMGDQARKRAGEVANQGKMRASDGLSALGRAVSDTAAVIDERLGAKYGDYARSAARSMQETAARIEAKEFGEIGEDVLEFVRKSPGTAIGVAAVTGFFLARLLGVGGSKE